MKRIALSLLTFIIGLGTGVFAGNFVKTSNSDELQGNITLSGAFALYPITIKWAEEFRKLHPKVKIDVTAGGAGKGITDVLSKITDIGLVSRDLNPEETKKGAYPVSVTKDAVVPTVSANNPFLRDLLVKGIKKDALNNIFITGLNKTWAQATGIKTAASLHVYTRSDAAGAAETWAKYFGKKQEDLQGIAVYGDPGLAQAVKKDPVGIGFNNMVYVYDVKTKKATNGLVVVPIDLNNNGKIDVDENFYDNIDAITDAIAKGKYPAPPARELYFVTNGPPKNKLVNEFVKFVLTQGQQYVGVAGYIQLSKEKIAIELNKIAIR